MPQASAAVVRSDPSSTNARHSIRRAAEAFLVCVAAARRSAAVKSNRVIAIALPIDAAPLQEQHRVSLAPIWESLRVSPKGHWYYLPFDSVTVASQPASRL